MNNVAKMYMLSEGRKTGNDRMGGDDRHMNYTTPMTERYTETESRFRDRRGREHYDNGRYAPRNTYGDNEAVSEPIGMIGFDRDITSRGYPTSDYRKDEDHDTVRRMEMGGGYQSHYDYPHGDDEMSHKTSHKMGGHASGSESEFTPEIAREWVKKMHREDGGIGEKWSLEEVKALMRQKGIEADPYKVWVAMNAEYADKCKVNQKYGLSSKDYYLDVAVASWLMDKDAVKDKLGAYYEYIVKK